MAAAAGPNGRKSGPQSRAWRQLFRKQFHKTKMCRFFLAGECRYGQECPYAHDESEIECTPDLTKTTLCQDFQEGKCSRLAHECPFAHGPEELRTTQVFTNSPLCKRGQRDSLGPDSPTSAAAKEAGSPTSFHMPAMPPGDGMMPQSPQSPQHQQQQQQLQHGAAPPGVLAPPAQWASPQPPQHAPRFLQQPAPMQAHGRMMPAHVEVQCAAMPPQPQPPSPKRDGAAGGKKKGRGQGQGAAPDQQLFEGMPALPTGGYAAPVYSPKEPLSPVGYNASRPFATDSPMAAWGAEMPAGGAQGGGGYPQTQVVRGRPAVAAPRHTPPMLPSPGPPGADAGLLMYAPGILSPGLLGARELETVPEKARLALVSDASPGAASTTGTPSPVRPSPINTVRVPACAESPDSSPRWMADPAYVSNTSADYRSVSPGGHSDGSERSFSKAREGYSPERCWPRTPSSCPSPGQGSPAQRWPHTPTSTAGASPNVSPSPRRARGNLCAAALNRRLLDVFPSTEEPPSPGPERAPRTRMGEAPPGLLSGASTNVVGGPRGLPMHPLHSLRS